MDGMLSQEEINALLSGMNEPEEEPDNGLKSTSGEEFLSDTEADALGELSNISMGSAATALFSLLNQKVNITTPKVSYATWEDLLKSYGKPCVFVQIYYKEGIQGNNVFILNERDVKIITDLMMGGEGVDDGQELNELHLSAISEAMNQMMGSAATSLSSMLETRIDISPPISSLVDLNQDIDKDALADFLSGKFVKVSFRLEVGDMINSELMQLYPIDFAKSLYKHFVKYAGIEEEPKAMDTMSIPEPQPEPEPQQFQAPPVQPMQQPMQQPMMQGMPMQGMPMQGMPMQQQYTQYMMPPVQDVNIAPVQFQPFQPSVASTLFQTENIDLLLDVPLEVTAELGRTSKSIKEILDFAPGTIIELNRLAGEPVDVLVNGKFVAKGEVVLIDEAFGIKVTEIIKQ